MRVLVRESLLPRPGRGPSGHDVVVLVDWLDSYDEVVAIGDHHVRDLVEGLAKDLDAVHLEDLRTVSGFNNSN